MRAIRTFVVLVGVFSAALALLAPFLSIDVPWGTEVWFLQSIQELGSGFHLLPTLNGAPFIGPDPLVSVLLSFLPFSDLMSLKFMGILMGCLVSMSVFVFCSSLWDLGSGVCAALFTMTTWGFVATFGTLNPAALPACLAVIAFLLFAQIYLTDQGPWWYLLSYLLLCIAAVTGGWVPLAFFLLSAVLFILIDMSPQRFLTIKAPFGIVLTAGAMLFVYVAYRVIEGAPAAGSLFSFDQEQGLFARLLLWLKFNLPWLLLVIPAWMFGEGPKEAGSWRSLLAAKTGYAVGFVVVLLARNVQEAYAFLGIPFGAIVIGYWMSRRFLIQQSIQALRTLAAVGTAAVVVATALFLITKGSLLEFSLDVAHGAVILAFLMTCLLFIWFARKRYTMAIAAAGMAAVFAMSWYAALVLIPAAAAKPAAFAQQLRTAAPLLVFQDDLSMRGYAGYAGAKAVVVGRNMVPVGYSAYLAVATPDLEALLKDLSPRMRVEPVSSIKAQKTLALIRVSPAAPRPVRSGG